MKTPALAEGAVIVAAAAFAGLGAGVWALNGIAARLSAMIEIRVLRRRLVVRRVVRIQ